MSVFKGSRPLRGGGLAVSAAPPPAAAVSRLAAPAYGPPAPAAVSPQAPRPATVVMLEQHRQLDLISPVRRAGFYLALVLVFIRFGMVHEILFHYFSSSNYLIPIFGIPAAAAMLASGGLRRILQYRSARYWMALGVWLVVTIPFSEWHGGSFTLVFGYLRAGWIMVFLIGGLVMTWKECRQMMYAVALGGVVNLITYTLSGTPSEADRISLAMGGSIANANDLAAHLMLVLSFVLFAALTSKPAKLARPLAVVLSCVGLYDIVRTGSRGAVLALGLCVIFILLRAPVRARIAVALGIPVLALALSALTPRETLIRYATIFSSAPDPADDTTDPSVTQDAENSTRARTYLLETSTLLTLQHPLFGVGPGEFEDEEAAVAKKANRHAAWAVPHNSYTQLSSEAGIPALAFQLAALGSAFLLLHRIYKQSAARPAFRAMQYGALCAMLAMVAFCTAIFFLSLVYFFYLPSLGGIAIALGQAASTESARLQPAGR